MQRRAQRYIGADSEMLCRTLDVLAVVGSPSFFTAFMRCVLSLANDLSSSVSEESFSTWCWPR